MKSKSCIALAAFAFGSLLFITHPNSVMAYGGSESPSFCLTAGTQSGDDDADRIVVTDRGMDTTEAPMVLNAEVQYGAADFPAVLSENQVAEAGAVQADSTEVCVPADDQRSEENADEAADGGAEVNASSDDQSLEENADHDAGQANMSAGNGAAPADAAAGHETAPADAAAGHDEDQIHTAADQDGDSIRVLADPQYRQTIQDGTYIIMSEVAGFKALDVSGASGADGANVQLYDANGTRAQKFTVTWNADTSSYAIVNANSGKNLTVAGNSTSSGANLEQNAANGSNGQSWYIVQKNGGYSIISALSGMAVDIADASSANGTNAWLYTPNGTKAQLFRFLASSDAYVHFTDGVYTFATAVDPSKNLDITAASMNSCGNLQIYSGNGTAAQKFILTSAGGDTWRITSLNSGMSMDLNGAGRQSGTNVRQYSNNDSAGQRWYIRNTGDGTCYIVPVAAPDNALDVAAAGTKNGTNVQSYRKNGTAAQKFIATRVDYTSPVSGEYVIVNAKSGRALDVKAGSRKMQANVQLYDQNGTRAQKFIVHDLGNGFVTIENANSRHYLDVVGGSCSDAANVQQYRDNGTMAQRWVVHVNGDGTYSFVNAKSSKALDIAGGATGNGANVQQFSYNGSGAQRFRVTQVPGDVNEAVIDYSVEPTVRDQYPEACARLDQVGWNLHTALNDCAAMKYVSTSYTLNAQNVHAIAGYGFSTRGGDCYVMACSFYEMAKALGYSAHVMFGYVPLLRGGMGPHAWVEIDNFEGNGTRVFDPDFQHEAKKDGYNIYYGKPGTWRYTNNQRIN